MKNLIRKVLFLIVSVLLFSCSKNDEVATNPESFFNLNVGSKWVYKKYENNFNNPTQFTFSGIVDTVKIVSIENIQGITFAKKSSKKVNINTGNVQPITYSYVRINNLGHLIEISEDNIVGTITETSGLVIHPINDFNYTYTTDVNPGEIVGNIEYHLYNAINMNVEGSTYSVLPYNGVFTPAANHPELISKTVEFNYTQNIGLVKYVCHAVAGNYSWEERLVSYQLN
jgi:hypothetical protein